MFLKTKSLCGNSSLPEATAFSHRLSAVATKTQALQVARREFISALLYRHNVVDHSRFRALARFQTFLAKRLAVQLPFSRRSPFGRFVKVLRKVISPVSVVLLIRQPFVFFTVLPFHESRTTGIAARSFRFSRHSVFPSVNSIIRAFTAFSVYFRLLSSTLFKHERQIEFRAFPRLDFSFCKWQLCNSRDDFRVYSSTDRLCISR